MAGSTFQVSSGDPTARKFRPPELMADHLSVVLKHTSQRTDIMFFYNSPQFILKNFAFIHLYV